MKLDSFYILFSNCIPVKGYTRAIIYDLTRETFDFIPINLFQILNKFKGKKIIDIINTFDEKEKVIVKEYFDFLIQKEYIYQCSKSETKRFPTFLNKWNSPYLISTLIIEYSDKISVQETLKNVENYGKLNVQVRFNKEINISRINEILSNIVGRRINSLELVLPYNDEINVSLVEELSLTYQFVSIWMFYNSPVNKKLITSTANVIFTQQNVLEKGHCGFISPQYFSVNIETFTESVCCNSCLNGKLCINKDGLIMNCLDLVSSYGSINSTTLIKVIESKEFKRYSKIKKDQIDVCKDCEFRYMCTDCRAYIKDPENIYSQPSRCTYNPYIAKWQGEEGYVPVEECGTYSREKGFVVNHERVAELNTQIWGE